ncbi:MAG: GNAT family N-acetyltransferase [Chthoniobacterales bacterium]
MPTIRFDYLARHPALADELAKFAWAEWQHIYRARGDTFADAQRSYRERANSDRLPLALVAFDGGELVGTVSLKEQDLEIRPEITPWLGGLYVIPQARGRGVASLLMQRAVQEARRLKLPTLFLWTPSAETLYRRLGWREVERTEYCGKRIVIMQSRLS